MPASVSQVVSTAALPEDTSVISANPWNPCCSFTRYNRVDEDVESFFDLLGLKMEHGHAQA
jgi:hypothetical protein